MEKTEALTGKVPCQIIGRNTINLCPSFQSPEFFCCVTVSERVPKGDRCPTKSKIIKSGFVLKKKMNTKSEFMGNTGDSAETTSNSSSSVPF